MFHPLQRGDKIGIFSSSVPATATSKLRYSRGKDFLEEKGFKIIEGNLTGKQDGYRSGTPKERAEEFNQLLRDPSVKMIMSSIGGTNSNSLLPYIDYEAFKNNPKIVIGYSDTTAFESWMVKLFLFLPMSTVPIPARCFFGNRQKNMFGHDQPVDYVYRTLALAINKTFRHSKGY